MSLTKKQNKWRQTVSEVLKKHKQTGKKVSLNNVLKEASRKYKTKRGGFIAAGSRLHPSNYTETVANHNKNANATEIRNLTEL